MNKESRVPSKWLHADKHPADKHPADKHPADKDTANKLSAKQPEKSNSNRKRRLGMILRIIASNPGITLSKLQKTLATEGLQLTERTLAKEIAELKSEYRLLSPRERLRSGYVLEGILSLSNLEAELVMDALQVFGVKFSDRESLELLKRLRRTLTKLKDGSGEIQFKIQLTNPLEFLNWVRSFGSRAWLVSPPGLVEKERLEARRLLQRYSG